SRSWKRSIARRTRRWRRRRRSGVSVGGSELMSMLRLILRRLIAMVIDVALLFLVLWPAGLGVLLASGLRPQTGPQVYAVLLVNFSLPVWAYFMLSDASGSGRTVGKWLMGIRVSAIGW